MTSDRPLLRVVRGDPRPEELAALVAVVTARSGSVSATPDELDSAAASSGPPRSPVARSRAASAWREHSRLVRQPIWPGPDAWRGSARPH